MVAASCAPTDRGDLTHVRAAEGALRAITSDQVFETELEIMVHAIRVAAVS
jgi:hypothetical protein